MRSQVEAEDYLAGLGIVGVLHLHTAQVVRCSRACASVFVLWIKRRTHQFFQYGSSFRICSNDLTNSNTQVDALAKVFSECVSCVHSDPMPVDGTLELSNYEYV